MDEVSGRLDRDGPRLHGEGRALEDDAKLELAAIIGPSPSPDHETGKA